MSWLYYSRPSFTHVSTHQTHVGKALFEHARKCATIAAVACMSSSLLKSSLGPNLLALIRVECGTLDLFDKIFLEFNPHMQLTQKLVVYVDLAKSTGFIEKLKSNGPLFSSSLQHAEIHLHCLRSLGSCRSVRSLTLSKIEQCEQLSVLQSLPSLSVLKLDDCHYFDTIFFEALGDLENNRNFSSLEISDFSIWRWSSEGFQNDFCGRLLSKDRLLKLQLSSAFWDSMKRADKEAFVNAGMTNLVELGECVPAKLIRGDGFANLRILSVNKASDEDLVNIGNHCLFLEVFNAGGDMTGSFLNDENLVEDAFKQLWELNLSAPNLSDSDVGQGFCRFSIKTLSILTSCAFEGSCLQYLPNPDRLRSVSILNHSFSMPSLLRFVNLEELEMLRVQLSREDILSFAVFKQLKRISLSSCGDHVARGELFRILACKLPNLEQLYCFGTAASKWIEEDVEAILIGCKNLRVLTFALGGVGQELSFVEKYHWVRISGKLQKNETVNQNSGSRRKREE